MDILDLRRFELDPNLKMVTNHFGTQIIAYYFYLDLREKSMLGMEFEYPDSSRSDYFSGFSYKTVHEAWEDFEARLDSVHLVKELPRAPHQENPE